MNEFARFSVDLSEAVDLIQAVSACLAKMGNVAIAEDPLRIDGYKFPVPLPSTSWYIARRHTFPDGRHTGLDLNLTSGGDSDLGRPVYATCNGVVVYAQRAPGQYWGNLVITMSRDDDGLLFWRYAHLNEIRTFAGRNVQAGDEVGTIGKGGRDRYWAHLHLDAWRGEMASPGAYLDHNVRWVDPLVEWQTAGYAWNWGVRK